MNNDKKIIIVGLIITIILIFGGAVLLTFDKDDPKATEDDIVASNGLHWHSTLEIFINGKKQEIPENIGILPSKHEEIHTHEDATEGIIHMEMQGVVTKNETKLGRFFQIWGKSFSSTRIFDNMNGEGEIKMLVNGKENRDFENYLMKDKDKIKIIYE